MGMLILLPHTCSFHMDFGHENEIQYLLAGLICGYINPNLNPWKNEKYILKINNKDA